LKADVDAAEEIAVDFVFQDDCCCERTAGTPCNLLDCS
jgi:hypothetical protein